MPDFDEIDLALSEPDEDDDEVSSALKEGGGHEPPPAVSTPEQARQEPSPAPERTWMDALGDVGDTAKDTLVGALHGGSFGFDDEMASALAGIIPMYGDHAGDNMREANAAAQKRSPTGYRVGDAAGSVATSMLLPGGTAGAAESVLGKLAMRGATGALAGGAEAGLRAAGDEDEGSLDDRAIAALAAAPSSAAIAGGIGAGSSLVGSTFRGASDAMGRGADKARLKAWGVGKEALEGLDGTPEQAGRRLVQDGERLVPPNRLAPISASDYSGRFADKAGDINSGIDEQLALAQQRGAQLPPDVRGQVANSLYGQADDAFDSGYGAELAGALDRKAGQISNGRQQFTPQDVRAQKIGFDQNAFKGAPGSPESLQGQASLAAANQYRGMLGDYAQQGGDDIAEQYGALNRDYGTAATLRESSAAAGRAAETSGGWVPPAVGAAAGGLIGGPMGIAGGAALGYGLRGAGRNYGADIGANVARLGQGATAGLAVTSDWVAQQAPSSIALYQALAGERPEPMQTPGQQPGAQPMQQGSTSDEKVTDSTRGYKLPDAIMQNPQLLGPYAKDFSNLGDPNRVSADMERLARTPGSRFEADILNKYRRMTGDMK